MSGAVLVLLEWTVLRCMGPHPYAIRLPSRFGGRLHLAQVGFPVPFRCQPTGKVWVGDAPASPALNGRPLIYARCSCGAITEYEVVRHAE